MAGNRETALKNLPKGGRPKGAKNKFTGLKDSFLKAYKHEQGFGGDVALIQWAAENREAFLKMIHVMLPRRVQEEIKEDIHITWEAAEALKHDEPVDEAA